MSRTVELHPGTFWFALIVLLAVAITSLYQGTVIENQKQTINQYMGLEHGEHDGPEMPEPEGKPTYLITPEREQNFI